MKKIILIGFLLASSNLIAGDSCYDIGFKFGSCVARSMNGLVCKTGTNISIPISCQGKAETEQGREYPFNCVNSKISIY
ncbi:hypothetical protein [Aliarcobacter butzleri]|uniref:hypothetical protein n=1 Tax=Aliarcobacter butzleri TaxID=28197 RepID=UPI0021B55C74|nr:hypothetical protein [Aliarcobacter butzleri]MCT7570531.1 hypothetical protein [Aliarcobacter butzleri]